MIRFLRSLLALLLTLPALAQPSPKPAVLNVAFVVYPGVEVLDLSGPLDVLLKANRLTNNAYHCYTVAMADSGLATEQGGLHLRPDYSFANAPSPDIVVVPGSSPERIAQLQNNEAFITQLKALSSRASQTMSVCTGALLLGQAGVLNGHRATTHAAMTDALAQQFPKVKLVRGVRYVADGQVLTTAGVTAGIDGAFYLVEKLNGRAVAEAVARAMEYPHLKAINTQITKAKPVATQPMHMSMNKPVAAATPTQRPMVQTSPATALASATDPVCRMGISAATKHRCTYKGKTYGFCSASCRSIFVEKPQQYVP